MELQHKLARLRAQRGWSQEKLAEELGVSRQAVQKWERGAGTPDLENLIKLAKRFNVSMDALLLDSDQRVLEEMHKDALIQPEYGMQHKWESYAAQLDIEYIQSLEEGKDIAPYAELFNQIHKMPADSHKIRMADVLFDLVQALPQRSDYAYNEPSDLAAIRALRPKNREEKANLPERGTLLDRLRGAWFGRIAGCLLGKPIEGIRTEELHSLLRESGNWPMHRYILSTDITEEMMQKYNYRLEGKCWADTIFCAPSDDDTNYMVLAQVLIDECGRDFTPRDVGRIWLDYQPKKAYCTAERVALCNLVKGYLPPNSAKFQNPYREWIGAQIRGDYFGYINPGNPELAAEMAWRDASISHIKNGIYGEMFISAMIAQAAVEQDIEKIIQAGLNQIPVSSRLYEAVQTILAFYHQGISQTECAAKIHQMYDEHTAHGWCHTISNAMIVAMALLYGGGDYGKSICLAVQTGFDTDCNGATVGSILGMRGGEKAIDEAWLRPLNGQLDTQIFGIDRVDIRKMAEKTLSHIEME